MGNQQQRPRFRQWDLQSLEEASGIPQQQLLQLYDEFKRSAGRDGQLDKQEFQQLARRLGMPANEQYHPFRAFDTDRSGKLSFEEFVSAVVLMNQGGNQAHKFQYVIDQYNPNRQQGYITPEYGQQVFSSMNQFYGTQGDPCEMWEQIDNGRGGVSRDEFVNYLSQNSPYAQKFGGGRGSC
ncbi:unnamed protein product [Didymodactylos carnosus]|uniref:EF-hand domain-containing protein n=1 Tax=Didymodactylos carnosus TaxID=1234261 RepID=A0A8S2JP59_9BILA|nr:unnamed protein product [Didymodactylos carnosus]CAF3816947.1 unnamed protein product [Didymodactylos carnosus]